MTTLTKNASILIDKMDFSLISSQGQFTFGLGNGEFQFQPLKLIGCVQKDTKKADGSKFSFITMLSKNMADNKETELSLPIDSKNKQLLMEMCFLPNTNGGISALNPNADLSLISVEINNDPVLDLDGEQVIENGYPKVKSSLTVKSKANQVKFKFTNEDFDGLAIEDLIEMTDNEGIKLNAKEKIDIDKIIAKLLKVEA